MTKTTERRIPYTELRLVSVRCRVCHAQVTVDVAEPKQDRAWQEDRAFKCPICPDVDFGRNVKMALYHLRQGVQEAQAAGESEMVLVLPCQEGAS